MATLPDPRKVAGSLINRPIGVGGRYRPFYYLNALQRLRGPRSLEDRVRGRTVLVTGASSGIGEASALRLGSAGASVLLVARPSERLEQVEAEIRDHGGDAHAHPCDLAEEDDVERLAAEVLAAHGPVKVLVNNAGISIRRSAEESYDRMHDYRRTMELNYFGAVRLTLSLLPAMREQRSGHVVNVSTAGVQTRTPRFSGYVASKAALDAFADCVAAEVATDRVRFTTIHMPLVRTPMIEPTKGLYRSVPSISAEQAADWVAQAILYRPRQIGTPFGNAAAFWHAVSPTSLDAVRSAGYQLQPDTKQPTKGVTE